MKNLRLTLLLDRFLGVQLVWIILFAIGLFSIIWLAPDVLFKLVQYVFSGKLSLWQAGQMFLFHVPAVLQQTIPIAVLLGSILLFQRLSQNYELIALLSSGITPRRLMASVLGVGLVFALLHAAVEEWLLPYTAPRLERAYTELKLQKAEDRNFLFLEKNHQDQLAKLFMIGQIQKPQLSDFVVLYYEDNGEHGVRISRILRSKTGEWMAGSEQWRLLDGIEYVLNDEGVYKDIRRFAQQQVRTSKYAAILLDYSRLNPMAMTWHQLKQFIKLLKEGGQLQDVSYYEVRLWQKWSMPAATAIFAVLGALLGMERIRTSRTYGLTFGAIIIFIYSIMVPFANNLTALSSTVPWMVAWLPLMVAVACGSVILKLRPKQG